MGLLFLLMVLGPVVQQSKGSEQRTAYYWDVVTWNQIPAPRRNLTSIARNMAFSLSPSISWHQVNQSRKMERMSSECPEARGDIEFLEHRLIRHIPGADMNLGVWRSEVI
jgi:hypothetical protein